MALEVQGSLHLESPEGHTLRIECEGDRLRLRVPSWRAARDALGGRPFAHIRRALLQRLHSALSCTALDLDIMVGRRVVASAGARNRPGLIARSVGLAPFAIHPWAALASLFDSQP